MTWSYSGDPSTSTLDQARYLCGDTDPGAPLATDEEIMYQVTRRGGSAPAAAPMICVTIMAKLAREVDYTIGPESVKASQRFKAYKDLVNSLRALWMAESAAPSWQEPISKVPRPIFDVGMHDNGTGGSGNGLSN